MCFATTAMALLQGGVDTSSIALWLGHESPATTHVYLDANLALKVKILIPDVVSDSPQSSS
jgi:integrase/recombinase XerD